MICLKNKVILFLLAFIATLQVGLVFRVEKLIRTVEAFEPVVVVECVKEEVKEEPVIEVVPEVVEPIVEPEPIPEPIPEPAPIRIDCRLDDETQQMILEKCEEYGIDFAFTMAVIFKESSFRPDADSGSSVGLMQINRINHDWLSKELGITNFFDPEQNVTAGLHMLRNLFEKYDDPHTVLMAYNMGEYGAKKQWDKGIFTSAYSEGVLQVADKYNQEIMERMGE